jgi:hypothetical protein
MKSWFDLTSSSSKRANLPRGFFSRALLSKDCVCVRECVYGREREGGR